VMLALTRKQPCIARAKRRSTPGFRTRAKTATHHGKGQKAIDSSVFGLAQSSHFFALQSPFLFRKMSNSVVVVARLIIVALCLLVKPVSGQSGGVTAGDSADYMGLAKSILRPDVTGVTINSVVFTGDARQIGNYYVTGSFFDGLPRTGVVLSTGKVINVRQGGSPSFSFGTAGDTNLSNELKKIGLTGQDALTYDAAVLVVDVTVSRAVDIDIAYVFGSREHAWDIGYKKPDVFGLFHRGSNVALIGKNNDPVSVKTVVSCDTIPPKNCDQFISNSPLRVGTSLGGYTKMQIATLKLPVGTNQRVKIAIADGSGNVDDSAVFASFLRLTPTRSPTQKPTPSPTRSPTQTPTYSPMMATAKNGVKATQSADFMGLAKSILRPDVTGVTINSAVFTGDARQIGTYAATGTLFTGLPQSGVVMSSGRVIDVQQGLIPFRSFDHSGDDDLSKVLQGIGLTGRDTSTYDAAVLVVDVSVSKAVDIDIAYVFGSAEYSLPLLDQYADVFGLFHGGGNVARIGNDPVSVPTVHCVASPPRNCIQFIDNPGRVGTSLGGYTKTQVATLKLPVGANQKLKIAIADARGRLDDSAVFLSFLPPPTRSPTRKPTMKPTWSPTLKPTKKPTRKPTMSPTMKPTWTPTLKPTVKPTRKPTMKPTMEPTGKPTTLKPTQSPTLTPTVSPTMEPTHSPTIEKHGLRGRK
jgi:PT repeat